MLSQRNVRVLCAQKLLHDTVGNDNFVSSLVEQEIASRAAAFVGSKYSTWTDTVLGLRQIGAARRMQAARAAAEGKETTTPTSSLTFLFEDLFSLGVHLEKVAGRPAERPTD